MLLHNRNTYKTRKTMILYGIISIVCFTLGLFLIMASLIIEKWWMYLINILMFIIFFLSFFLLVLENNDYKLIHYFNKKKFNVLYNEFLLKYNINSKKNKRKIKKELLDYFYQFGELNIKNNNIETMVFIDWLENHSYDEYISGGSSNKLEYFLYGLLGVVGLYGNYRINLHNLINIYNKDEIKKLLENCLFIKQPFLDKCLFLYDYTSLISEQFLTNMYLELVYIIEGIINLINEDEFGYLMYNPNFHYTEDKKISYEIVKEDESFSIYIRDLQYDYIEKLEEKFNSENTAFETIKENIKNYESNKN